MNPGTIDTIKSKINKVYDTQQNLITKQKEQANAMVDVQAAELIAGNSNGFITDEDLFTQLDSIGYTLSAKERADILSDQQPTIAQLDEYSNLELKVNLGQIGPSHLDEARLENRITYKQAATLKDKYNKTQTTLKAGNDIIYKTFRIDELELKQMGRNDPTRALIAEAQDMLDKRRIEVLRMQEQDPSVIFNQREEARAIAEQVKGEYIQSQAPVVWTIANRLLKDYPEYYNSEDAFLTLSEEQVKQMVMDNDKVSQRNKQRYAARIIEHLRKLKSYKLGVIPSEK
jgi:hypothetical protein